MSPGLCDPAAPGPTGGDVVPAEEFSTVEVCEITGASYRQVDYWVRCGVVCPTRAARGSGSQRRFGRDHLALVRALLLLAGLGASNDVRRRFAHALMSRPEMFDGQVVVDKDGVAYRVGDGSLPDGWIVDLAAAEAWVEDREEDRRDDLTLVPVA
jgi:DNA-binding transcriptional MerR regulator